MRITISIVKIFDETLGVYGEFEKRSGKFMGNIVKLIGNSGVKNWHPQHR